MVYLTNRRGSTMTLPLTMSWQKSKLDISVSLEKFSRGHGSAFAGSSINPKLFEVSGTLCFADKETNRQIADSLYRFLSYGPIEVSRDGSTYITGYVTGIEKDGMDDDAEIQLVMSFTAPDPFFYGGERSEVATFSAAGSMVVESEGNEDSEPVIIMDVTTGTMVDPKLSVGDYLIEIFGSYAAGQVVVDCKRMRATYEGNGIFAAMGEDWMIDGFVLIPESQEIVFSADGNYTVDVQVKWRPKYRS